MPRKTIGLPSGDNIVGPLSVSLAGPVLVGGGLDPNVGAMEGAGVEVELPPPQPASAAAPIKVNSTERRRVDASVGVDGVETSLLLGLNMITLSSVVEQCAEANKVYNGKKVNDVSFASRNNYDEM